MKKTLPEKLEYQLLNMFSTDTVTVPNILVRHYRDMGLTAEDFVAICGMLAAAPKGVGRLNYSDMYRFFHCDELVTRTYVSSLVQKGVLKRLDDNDNYSFEPLYDKIKEFCMYMLVHKDAKLPSEQSTCLKGKVEAKEVYQCFEQELGRPLSPIEFDKINDWLTLDMWSNEIVIEALSRAVLYNACSFPYIDKILRRWKKQGFTTLEQVRAEGQMGTEGATTKYAGRSIASRDKAKKKGTSTKAIQPMTAEKTNYNEIF